MKKNKLQKIIVLLLALILCTVSTMPTVAKAASKITLKSGAAAPSTIYAGHSYTLKVSGTAVKFTSSNKKVATIGATTGKLKAVAPGTVKITAKNKKTGKTVATKTFTVLQRAKAITADNEIYLSSVGDTATIKATKTPATSTDVVRFSSSDKTIATVGATSGKVTAIAEGKTTISVYSKATKATANSNKNNKIATVNIFVGPCIDTVQQISVDKVAVTFKSSIKEVAAKDITITSNTSKVLYAVSNVTVDKNDTKRVIVSTYAKLPFSDNMTLTYGKTAGNFTTTDGQIASIKIAPLKITCEHEVLMYFDVCDGNGVILENLPLTSSNKYECSLEVTGGYTKENILYVNDLTSTAKARVIYHTYKFENGNEVGKIDTGDVVITVTPEIFGEAKYTIADTNANVDFNAFNYKQDTDISVEEKHKSVHIQIMDSVGLEVANYSKYKVEVSNPEIFVVRNDLSNTNKKLEIVAIKEGTAYLIVTDANTKKTLTSLPITVKKKSEPVSIMIDKLDFKVAQSIGRVAAESFVINVLDQYGETMSEDNLLMSQFSITEVSNSTGKLEDCISISNNKVTLYTSNRPEATYVFRIKYAKLPEKFIKVAYVKPTGNETFQLILHNQSSTTPITESVKEIMIQDDSSIDLAVNLNTLIGNIAVKSQNIKETNATVTIKNQNGEDVTSLYYSEGKFSIQSFENNLVNTLPEGVYTISGTLTNANNENITVANTVKIVINKQSTVELPEEPIKELDYIPELVCR